MLQNIFISYRRSDSQDIAGRIYDRLVSHFGKGKVFKDVDSIPVGVDFRRQLSDVVGSCDVLLAVVGERWLNAKDDSGGRRLDSGTDLVRIEIEAALARGIPVIPVLVGNTKMPSESDWPPSVAPLVYRQSVPVRPDPDFHRDMDRLNAALKSILESGHSLPPRQEGVNATNLHEQTHGQNIKPAVEDPQAVREAINLLNATGVNAEVTNLVPVARTLHDASRGGEVLPLCTILGDAKAMVLDQYKALKLLGVVLRLPEAKPHLGAALDAIVDNGMLRSELQSAAQEALRAVPASPAEKWERLFNVLPVAGERILRDIVNSIAQVTPPLERRRTVQQLAEILEMSSDWSVCSSICGVLKQFGDRGVVPSLIRILEVSLPTKAALISDVLTSWHIVDAIPAIRTAIENGRWSADYTVAEIVKNLYQLEGSVCYGFLAEILRDAVPGVQSNILRQLPGINEPIFMDVVDDLATNSPDSTVKQRAREFLTKAIAT